MALHITPVVFDCPPNARDPPGRVLKMTAKRYWTTESAANDEGFSLLFAHCIGSHKEQWEPIIEHTFRIQQGKARHQRVREAWSFDWQSHGAAAVLNRDLLNTHRGDGVCASTFRYPSAYEWAEAIAAFVRSPRLQGRRIVGIGHSAGAGAMSVIAVPIPQIPLLGLVLVEPTIATPELYHRTMAEISPSIEAATLMRRDRWRGRAEAAEWLWRRSPHKRWDARVFDLFIEHGLVDTPEGGVKLKCDRRHEALAFPDVHPHFDALTELGRIRGAVAVHLVWAARSEFVPKAMQDALLDWCRFASITRVEGGHLVVQESPVRVAHAIASALDAVGVAIPAERSRL
ncbi:Alpha/Beta hydrolase protein [Mycena haematopus]|nr:Alpha/Beta hydrolase protein [Mycena haematopus]